MKTEKKQNKNRAMITKTKTTFIDNFICKYKIDYNLGEGLVEKRSSRAKKTIHYVWLYSLVAL